MGATGRIRPGRTRVKNARLCADRCGPTGKGLGRPYRRACAAVCGIMTVVDNELPEAMDALIQLIDTMPGTFRGEFQLGYWGGVTEGADAWSVRVEADIEDTEFFVTGSTPSAVLRKALEEAKRKIPPTSRSSPD